MIRHTLRWLLAAFYAFAGYVHLANPAPFLSIMPAWVPAPEAVLGSDDGGSAGEGAAAIPAAAAAAIDYDRRDDGSGGNSLSCCDSDEHDDY